MLIVVEDWNLTTLDQLTLNLKALWSLDIFEVNTTKGISNALNSIDEVSSSLAINFDINSVNASKTIEQ